MVMARFWAKTGIATAASKLPASRPAIRFMNGASARLEVGVRQDRLHQIIEYLGLRRHATVGVGVHVPAAQLVQRRGFLIGEVQDIAVARARAASAIQDL